MILSVFFVFIVAGLAVCEQTTMPPSPCDVLANAMHHAFWNFLVNANTSAAVSQAQYQMRRISGADFLNDNQVHELACKLIGVRNLHELADLLPISYNELYRLYEENLFMLQMMGGIQGYRMHILVLSNLLDGALRMGFPNTQLPLAVPVNGIAAFLRHMVNEYGPAFLSAVNFDVEPLIVTSPSKLAHDLVSAQSLDELAQMSGFPAHQVHAIWGRLGHEIQENAYRWESRADESLLYLLEVLDDQRLLELQP